MAKCSWRSARRLQISLARIDVKLGHSIRNSTMGFLKFMVCLLDFFLDDYSKIIMIPPTLDKFIKSKEADLQAFILRKMTISEISHVLLKCSMK